MEPNKQTRARAEKALATGADPTLYTAHANYHVRAKAWRKMGCPVPEDRKIAEAFLLSLHISDDKYLPPKPVRIVAETAPSVSETEEV